MIKQICTLYTAKQWQQQKVAGIVAKCPWMEYKWSNPLFINQTFKMKNEYYYYYVIMEFIDLKCDPNDANGLIESIWMNINILTIFTTINTNYSISIFLSSYLYSNHLVLQYNIHSNMQYYQIMVIFSFNMLINITFVLNL